MERADHTDFDRLRTAVELFFAWEADPARPTWEGFLAEHADLRDLLEPLLDDNPATPEDTVPPAGPAAAGEDDSAPPLRRIAGYALERELGRGGMGVVFAARDLSLGRHVALKLLADHVTGDAAAIARFHREASLAARLEHPGIVRVHGAGTDGGVWFIAMELIEGTSLDRVLRRVAAEDPATRDAESLLQAVAAELGRPPRSAAPSTTRRPRIAGWSTAMVELFVQLATALDHAHARGVIHRDVKPSNILVRTDGTAALADFGLAREFGGPSLTRTGTFAGTPHYIAPEQAAGRSDDIDGRADVFSLGASLYEALTLALPFPGDDAHAVLLRVVGDDPLDPRRHDPRIDPDLSAVVLKALEKNPARRYASVGELADDLCAFLDRRPVRARRITAWHRFERWVRRRPLVAGLAATALLSLVLGLAVSLLAWHDADTQRARLLRRNDDFSLLANVARLDSARRAERTLYPAWPSLAPALEAWLAGDYHSVETALPDVSARLADLRGELTGAAAEERTSDQYVARQLLAKMLAKLLADAEAFAARADDVRSRLAWAERVEKLSIERHAARWAEARAAIRRADGVTASTLYHRDPPIDLKPQIGLVPLGMNPRTKLWEFAHLRSAADPEVLPELGGDGHIDVGEDTGIVFVLLPGGTAEVGAQQSDPQAPFYDPWNNADDTLNSVELGPFFLALHELTQSQWRRLTGGETPSGYGKGHSDLIGGTIDGTHPVEQITWTEAHDVLVRHGLTLPTEAQWEYGCRAGTDTIWWTGQDPTSLAQGGPAGNLLDLTEVRSGSHDGPVQPPDYDDGFVIHCSVDALRANPWGLYQVYGNVWEWCLDDGLSYEAPTHPGNGLRYTPDGKGNPSRRVVRGGDYRCKATDARSALREGLDPAIRAFSIGARAAREVDASGAPTR